MTTTPFPTSVAYSSGYVGFADILGFSEYVLSGKESPQSIASALFEIQLSSGEMLFDAFDARLMSDSIVLTSKNDRPDAFWQMKNAFQLDRTGLLKRGLLLRGGIVHGKFFSRGSIVFGPGIISAVRLERQAKYPRVLVEKQCWDLASSAVRKLTEDYCQVDSPGGPLVVCPDEIVPCELPGYMQIDQFLEDHGVRFVTTRKDPMHWPGDPPIAPNRVAALKQQAIETIRQYHALIDEPRLDPGVSEKYDYLRIEITQKGIWQMPDI